MKRRKAKLRRHSWWAVPILLGTLLGATLWAIGPAQAGLGWLSTQLRNPRFQLRSVEFIGLQTLSPEELYARAEFPSGQALMDVDVESVSDQICSHARIAACTGARIPPDRLVFEIEERIPVARLSDGRGVDLDGVVFELALAEAKDLPVLNGPVAYALPLLRASYARGVPIARIDAPARDDVRFQPKGKQVDVRVGRDPEASLEDWILLRDTALLRGYAARHVDLRFRGNAVLKDFRETEGGSRDGSK